MHDSFGVGLRLDMRCHLTWLHSLLLIYPYFIVLDITILLSFRVEWGINNWWKLFLDLIDLHMLVRLACFYLLCRSLFLFTDLLWYFAVVSPAAATFPTYIFNLSIKAVLVTHSPRSIEINPLIDTRRYTCDFGCLIFGWITSLYWFGSNSNVNWV
jgi:hypothetical protein